MGSYQRLLILCTALVAIAGCSTSPFRTGSPAPSAPAPQGTRASRAAVPSSPHHRAAPATRRRAVDRSAPARAAAARATARSRPATLGPASTALVSQAQSQRKRGDFPGATVSIERALRIEPNNPLLWIEMGRLRMDQANFPAGREHGPQGPVDVGRRRPHAVSRVAAHRRLLQGARQESAGAGRIGTLEGAGSALSSPARARRRERPGARRAAASLPPTCT